MKKEFKTYNEWNNEGYKVLKGSKHISRNKDGTPLFSQNQVAIYGSHNNQEYRDFFEEDNHGDGGACWGGGI